MSTRRQDRPISLIDPLSEPASERRALDEDSFRRVIAIERKRTERSRSPFVLVLIEVSDLGFMGTMRALESTLSILLGSSRDTDLVGWYRSGQIVGALYTGVVGPDKGAILKTILARVTATLRDQLSFEHFNQVKISLHYFPDDWDHDSSGRPSNPALYPDLSKVSKNKLPHLIIKRAMDILGGGVLAIICLPVCFFIALAIKVTSRGPVLFRQQRVGQYGRQFTLLKFRSMYSNNDASVHQKFVTKLINSQVEKTSADSDVAYKLTTDRRITPLGKFLRRTSLDELPQFLNVLKGDMSLVGPRPPIPYELAVYQTWHRRRLLEVKPGITGLWQVTGRSTVDFDSMVRLDLKYATSWNPRLDLEILLRTPLAVIRGSGAC